MKLLFVLRSLAQRLAVGTASTARPLRRTQPSDPRLTQKASTGLSIPPDARACGFLLVEDVALTVRRAAARSFRTLYTVSVEPCLSRLFAILTARVQAIFNVRSAGFHAEILYQ